MVLPSHVGDLPDMQSKQGPQIGCNQETLQQGPQIGCNQEKLQQVLWCLMYGMGDLRIQAVEEIRRLTKTSAKSRAYLGAAGAIPPLVSMLKSSSMDGKEAALLSLLNLAVRNERNKLAIMKAGAMSPLVELLQSENMNLRESTAAAVLTLSASNGNKPLIGASGAVPLLVDLLTSGSIQARVDAVMALYNLSTHLDNVKLVVAAGATTPLVLLLKDCKRSSKVAEKITALLELLMGFEEGRGSVVKEDGGLLVIVEVLEEGSAQGREHAVGALLTMCESDRCKYKEAILQEGVIPGLLEMTVQGRPPVREKARRLLDLLRDSPRLQRPASVSASASAVLESIVYDIAAHVDNAEAGNGGAAKKMLTEMVRLSMEQSMQHLQHKAMVGSGAPQDIFIRPRSETKVRSE